MENNGTILNNQPEKTVDNEELKQMIETNIALSQEILGLAIYIKKYIVWQKIFAYLKLLIIIIPIILAVVYLPPFFKTLLDSLKELGIGVEAYQSLLLNK